MVRALAWPVVACLAGCGRFAFDERATGDAVDAADEPDAPNGFTGARFPRLGSLSISNSHAYSDLTFRQEAAKRHVVVMSYYPEWQAGSPMTLAEVIADVKARSTIGTRMFIHINNHDSIDDPMDPGNTRYPLWQKLDQERWWLYPTGTTGAPVRHPFSASLGMPNTSTFVPPDSQGKRWADVNIEWHYAYAVAGDGDHAGNPQLDGFMIGNISGHALAPGDWDRDGDTDGQNDPAVVTAIQDEGKLYFDRLRTIWPGSIQLSSQLFWDPPIGNLDQISNGGGPGPMLGTGNSPESFAGFTEMLTRYRAALAATAAPKLVLFEHEGWQAGDYQAMRYGLGSCLLDDGYFDIDDGVNSLVDHALWFDEFDFDLGHATQLPPSAPWQNGVWRRDFERGIVLVNPKGNGPVTVTLETTFKRLSGAQDPTTNSGAPATTVMLADRDAILLAR